MIERLPTSCAAGSHQVKMIKCESGDADREARDWSLLNRYRCVIPLWTTRTDDEIIESCTIITTRPNELVAPVHDRMPVILPSRAEDKWLDLAISKEHALSLLEPYPAGLMVALPASTRVNSVRKDDPGLLLPDDALAA
jgi:putative SOS response-associated peptidase YedK